MTSCQMIYFLQDPSRRTVPLSLPKGLLTYEPGTLVKQNLSTLWELGVKEGKQLFKTSNFVTVCYFSNAFNFLS